jgi:protein-tyrosine-phosphatase
MVIESSVMARVRIHAALADPTRLTIVDGLMLGDASPSEVAHQLGLPTNLVAHHINVLVEAGVVQRVRSEHDLRRSYLRLQPGALAALAAPRLVPPRRVLFVCTHNSARSPLAAALWSALSSVPVASAGTVPAVRVNPRAVRTGRAHGLRIGEVRPAHMDDVMLEGDLVIAVCDHVHETLPADPARLHWSVPDPVPADTDDAFEAAYADLAGRVSRLAPALAAVAA